METKIGAGGRAGGSGARALQARLAAGPAIVMDGATGTELERRGVPTGLPLWSSHALLEAPAVVEEIHRDYASCGAEILTANTFRTQQRVLARVPDTAGGRKDLDRELTRCAVTLARAAANAADHPIWVAGSAPTLEDCYRPDMVPDSSSLAEEHGRHADNLADAGADLILVETMNTQREAVAAARAARATGLPFMLSFVSWRDALLLSGEPLADAIGALLEFEPIALLVNCLPASAVPACLPALRESGLPFGVYANLGAPQDETGFERDEDCTPDEFARYAADWARAGARLIGGCCGTTPLHIRAIAEKIRSD